ncbi:MAG: hypothetical protein AAF556_10465, partial [Pseudomonadota bacterium]
ANLPGLGGDVHDHIFETPTEQTRASFATMLGEAGIDTQSANVDGIADRVRDGAAARVTEEQEWAAGQGEDRPEAAAAEADFGSGPQTAQPRTAPVADLVIPSDKAGINVGNALRVVANDEGTKRLMGKAAEALPAVIENAARGAATGGLKGAAIAGGTALVKAVAGGEAVSPDAVISNVHEQRARRIADEPTPGDAIPMAGPPDRPALPPPRA